MQVLEQALQLGVWDLASNIAVVVAPLYSELRDRGCFEESSPDVEEALRNAYAGVLTSVPARRVLNEGRACDAGYARQSWCAM